MANKRKIYLIDPKFQIRFSVGLGLFVLFSSILFSFIVYAHFQHLLSLVHPNLVSNFNPETERKKFIILFFGSQVLYALLTALAGFFFSHQIAGPIYKLKKFLGEIRRGDSNGQLSFRKRDYFPEVADEINQTISYLKDDSKK